MTETINRACRLLENQIPLYKGNRPLSSEVVFIPRKEHAHLYSQNYHSLNGWRDIGAALGVVIRDNEVSFQLRERGRTMDELPEEFQLAILYMEDGGHDIGVRHFWKVKPKAQIIPSPWLENVMAATKFEIVEW